MRRFGARPALDFLGRKMSYAEVGEIVDRLAAGLQARGLKRGDRIGLFMPNTPYYPFFYFAALKAGAQIVNYNPLAAVMEIERQIIDSGTSWMVTLDVKLLIDKLRQAFGRTPLDRVIVCPLSGVLPPAKALATRLKALFRPAAPRGDAHFHRFAEYLRDPKDFVSVPIDPRHDVAILQYTGGTTGLPKAAMLTHANISANTEQCRLWFPEARMGEERVVAVLPFFHVFGMTVVMNLGMSFGAELLMLPRFTIAGLMTLIVTKRPTLMIGVPTIYAALNQAATEKPRDMTSIRFCFSGGAPLPVEVKTRFEQLTGCRLVEGYGLTESAPVAVAGPLDGRQKPACVGLPVPGTIIEIRDPEAIERVMPVGEKGEVCITGPQVMKGYLGRPEDTEAAVGHGFLRTGDIGYMDEEGWVFLVDRMKDLILCGGFNVYPRLVEEAINAHPAVAEVTVIGVPHQYRGETVKAFVVVRPGASLGAEELSAFLRDRLSPIETPKEIEFRESLPKTMIGKLSKKELVAEELAKRASA